MDTEMPGAGCSLHLDYRCPLWTRYMLAGGRSRLGRGEVKTPKESLRRSRSRCGSLWPN